MSANHVNMENRNLNEMYSFAISRQDFSHVGFDPNGEYSIGGFPMDLNEGSLILKADEYSKNYASPFCYPDVYFWEDAEQILFSEIGTKDYDLHFIEGGRISGSVKDNEQQGIEDIIVSASSTATGKTLISQLEHFAGRFEYFLFEFDCLFDNMI